MGANGVCSSRQIILRANIRAPLVIDDPVVGMIKPEALIAELSRRLEGGTLNESHQNLGPQSVDQLILISRLISRDFVRLDTRQLDHFLDRREEVLLSNRPLLNGTLILDQLAGPS